MTKLYLPYKYKTFSSPVSDKIFVVVVYVYGRRDSQKML